MCLRRITICLQRSENCRRHEHKRFFIWVKNYLLLKSFIIVTVVCSSQMSWGSLGYSRQIPTQSCEMWLVRLRKHTHKESQKLLNLAQRVELEKFMTSKVIVQLLDFARSSGFNRSFYTIFFKKIHDVNLEGLLELVMCENLRNWRIQLLNKCS